MVGVDAPSIVLCMIVNADEARHPDGRTAVEYAWVGQRDTLVGIRGLKEVFRDASTTDARFSVGVVAWLGRAPSFTTMTMAAFFGTFVHASH
jgi:hypothetical protein